MDDEIRADVLGGYALGVEETTNTHKNVAGNLNVGAQLRHRNVDWSRMLEPTTEECNMRMQTGFSCFRTGPRAILWTRHSFLVPQKEGNLLTSRMPISFSRRILLHEVVFASHFRITINYNAR